MNRFGRRAFLAVVASGVVAGCLSPTLPLPPPEPPTVEPVGQGMYALSGVIPEPGMVEALNLRTQEIFGLATERDYRFRIFAEPGDRIQLWYTTGGDLSEFTFFRIAEESESPGDAGAPDAAGPDAGSTGDAAP
jgi:hypothetical protein